MSIGTKLAVFLYHSQVLSGAGHRQKLRKSIGILETFGGKAMWQRNNGQAEDDLQFRFTAYLVSAVKRRRKDYLIQFYKRSSIESTVEVVYESEPSSEEVVLDRLPLMDVIENGALLEALQKLNERERQIFLARTLEEEDFETLGAKFGLSYKGVAALYYRTMSELFCFPVVLPVQAEMPRSLNSRNIDSGRFLWVSEVMVFRRLPPDI